MQCPGGGTLEAGDYTCCCGAAHWHPWASGGYLVGSCGTWRYVSDEERWAWAGGQSEPVAASVPDKPEVAVEVSTADGKLVITVSVRIELPRRFSARSFESWDVC